MLTERAMQERQWVPFPALRKVLEGKPIHSECADSTDETRGEAINRLLQTCTLVRQYETEIKQRSAANLTALLKDLRNLQSQLQDASRYLDAATREVDTVCASFSL